jgi:hypothetical protein
MKRDLTALVKLRRCPCGAPIPAWKKPIKMSLPAMCFSCEEEFRRERDK